MDKSNEFERKNEAQDLQIRCCQNCEAVHFKAGNVMLNFTKSEFADLTYSVNDLYQNEFGSLEYLSSRQIFESKRRRSFERHDFVNDKIFSLKNL